MVFYDKFNFYKNYKTWDVFSMYLGFFLSFVLCAFKHMGLPDGKLKTTIHLFKADIRIYSHILGIIAKTAIKDAKFLTAAS